MIHLLALRPYKKPELLARLMKGKVLHISKVPCVFIIPTITNLGGGGGGFRNHQVCVVSTNDSFAIKLSLMVDQLKPCLVNM